MPGIITRLLSTLFLATIVFGAFVARPASVAACSCISGGWDEADVIVIGTVTDWRVAEELGADDGFQPPLELTLSVEGVYKGNARETLHFLDSGSYREVSGGPARWAGSAGACGTFNFDPRGIRALYSLYDNDGSLRSSLCSGSVVPDPTDPNSDPGPALFRAQQVLGAPVDPSGAGSDSTNWRLVVGLVSAAGLAVLVTGSLIANRRSV